MAKKTPGPHNELIHCDACGEDFSITYKRCPFCGEKGGRSQAEDEYVFDGGYIFDELDSEQDEDDVQPRGGKRLSGSNRAGAERSSRPVSRASFSELLARTGHTPARAAGFIFTLVVIIAAFLIVTTIIIPMINRGSTQIPGTDPEQSQSQESDSPAPSDSVPMESDPVQTPSESVPVESIPVESTPVETTPVTPSTPVETTPVTPSTPVETIPVGQTATALTLSKTEFTISDRYPEPITLKATLLPAGSTGTVSWSSSNPAVATVDQNGKVTAVSAGQATITASLPGGITATCLVRSSVSGSTASTPTTTPSAPSTSTTPSGGTLTLSREDFTLNDTWPTYTFTVTGASGTVNWVSSNPSIASIDANGKVSKTGTGKCTITATDAAGNTATCIVRCN